MSPNAIDVQYKSNYRLVITFANNEVREFDIAPYLQYPVYTPLKDEAFCRKVTIVDGVLQWNEYIDIDPDTIYIDSILKYTLATV